MRIFYILLLHQFSSYHVLLLPLRLHILQEGYICCKRNKNTLSLSLILLSYILPSTPVNFFIFSAIPSSSTLSENGLCKLNYILYVHEIRIHVISNLYTAYLVRRHHKDFSEKVYNRPGRKLSFLFIEKFQLTLTSSKVFCKETLNSTTTLKDQEKNK